MQTRQELVLSFMHSLATNPAFLSNGTDRYPERIINMANKLVDEYLKSLE